jgi:hypothetical protein
MGVGTESSGLRNLMIAATAIAVVVLMLLTVPLMMSPMLFDSGESAAAWGVFAAVWSAPLLVTAGIAVGWIGFARNARRMVVAGLIVAAVLVLAAIGILVMAGF